MKIMVDGDSCCVMHLTEQIAHKYGIECHIYSDTSHIITPQYNDIFVHIVDKGPNSVDFTITNACSEGDIIITSDVGLAAIVLTKKCAVVSPYGVEFTDENIMSHLNYKSMKANARKKSKQSNIKGYGIPREKRNYQKTLTTVLQRMECIV